MRIQFIIYLIILGNLAYAQDLSVNVLTSTGNILYIGRNNIIEIPNLPARAKVSMHRGRLKYIGGKRFLVQEHHSNKLFDTLIIKEGTQIILKKAMKLAYNGAPIIAINGITYLDSVKISDIETAVKLTVSPDSLQYNVNRFKIVIQEKNGQKSNPIKSDGSLILPRKCGNSPIYNFTKSLQKGDIIYLEEINAVSKNESRPPFYQECVKIVIAGD